MKNERESKILDLLTKQNKAEVTELARMLGVSQVTVRKDLDQLEQKHIIRRVHGYAELNSTDDINGRLAYHYEIKKKIAERAAGLIHDGDTVMIESGSCCALLALQLAKTKKNITLVTNSAFIAAYIRDEKSVQVVLLGGIYQADSQCLVGPMIKEAAAGYNVDYFFVGTDGWSERTGFTNKDQMRAQAVRDMSQSSSKMVYLTESEKFRAAGTVPIHVKGHEEILITDDHIDSQVQTALLADHVEILTVQAD
jgi:DeoR/GlpR family transcriptional regulator of sugar metabolism